MKKERIQEILGSNEINDVTYKNRNVCIEDLSINMDDKVLVKDLLTNKLLEVSTNDLYE